MAAPATIDIKNLEGKWIINKTFSDPTDPVLSLQGIGWLIRKGIGAATITQSLTQAPTTGEDGQPTTQIDIVQTGTGGFKGSTEKRTLDWHYRPHSDWIFGSVQGRSRYTTLAKVSEEATGKGVVEEDAKYIVEGWLKETEDAGVVESYVENESSKWTGWQLWGFAEINGERRLVRRFAVRRTDNNKVVHVRLVYDYAGEL